MLDNFSVEMMRQAVAQTQGRAQLEVSGNVTSETAHLRRDRRGLHFGRRADQACDRARSVDALQMIPRPGRCRGVIVKLRSPPHFYSPLQTTSLLMEARRETRKKPLAVPPQTATVAFHTLMETTRGNATRLYPDRTDGGDRHHRHPSAPSAFPPTSAISRKRR